MTFIKKLSFAIQVVDDFTKGNPVGGYTILINGKSISPMKVVDGMLVYMGLDDPVYKISVKGDYYLEKSVDLVKTDLNSKNPIFKILLNPSSGYPFGRFDTLVRFQLIDEENKEALASAQVICHVTSKEHYLGKLRADIDPKEKNLSVSLVKDELEPKSTYALVAKDKVSSLEIIHRQLDGYLVGEFRGPPMEKGALVCPAINTVTDEKGNGIIYLNKFRNSSVSVVLALSYKGKEKIIHSDVKEFDIVNLGQLTM